MLLKLTSDAAAGVTPVALARGTAAVGEGGASLPRPSPQEREIAGLNLRIAELEEAARLRDDAWDRSLAEATTAIERRLEHAHRAAEDRSLALLEGALKDARAELDRTLPALCRDTARALALAGFGRLVARGRHEEQWLDRLLDRRIGELAAGSVVALQVASADFPADRLSSLRDTLPAGLSIATTAEVQSGSARIVMRLGTVEVAADPDLKPLESLLLEVPVDG